MRSHLGKLRAQKMITWCYKSQAQQLDKSDIALQLQVVEIKPLVTNKLHDATGNEIAPFEVS